MRLSKDMPNKISLVPLIDNIYPIHKGKKEYSLKMPKLPQALIQESAVRTIPQKKMLIA